MNILIFAPNHIGDAVMSTAFILTLKKNFPESKIYILATKFVMEIYKPFPAIDFLFEYDKSIKNTLAKIRGIKFEYSFCLAASFKVALISRLIGAKNIIGYGRNWRSPLLTQKLKYNRKQPEYIVNFYLKLLKFLDVKEWHTIPQVFLDENIKISTLIKIKNYGISIGIDKLACLLPGFSGYPVHNSKMWKNEYFAKVGKFLQDKGFKVFIVVGPKEEQLAIDIQAYNQSLIPVIRPTLSIQEVKAFLSVMDIFVSVDSGLRFIAMALGKKGVTLFGPVSRFWSIATSYHHELGLRTDFGISEGTEIPVYIDLPCSPCYLSNCPINGHPCMNNITSQMVIEKLQVIL